MKNGSKEEEEEKEPLHSPLTTISENEGTQVVFSFLLCNLTLIIILNIIGYFFNPDDLQTDLNFIIPQLSNWKAAVACWLAQHAVLLLIVYPTGSLLHNHHRIVAISGTLATAYIFYLNVSCVIEYQFGPVLRLAVLCEHMRLMMKTVSFLVEQTSAEDAGQTSVSKFIYFLFAPTLIYSHSYARSSGPIDWSRVGRLSLLWCAILYGGFLAYNRHVIHFLQDESRSLCKGFIFAVVCCSLTFSGAGIGFFHCYFNIWAEMLSFADRRFYGEWWTATTPQAFWSRWNLPVYNWIREYAYKPYIRWRQDKVEAAPVIFAGSGVVHEYITGFGLGLWCPIYALVYAFSAFMYVIQPKHSQSNFIAIVKSHLFVLLPFSVLFLFYWLEHIAQNTCSGEHFSFSSQLLPKFIACRLLI